MMVDVATGVVLVNIIDQCSLPAFVSLVGNVLVLDMSKKCPWDEGMS